MLYKIYKTLVTGLVWMVLLQVWYGWFCYRSGMDGSGTGTGGSSFSGKDQSYPGVPFSSQVHEISNTKIKFFLNKYF